MYIVLAKDRCNDTAYGEGDTLETAYRDFRETDGQADAEDCDFYEAVKIEVEQKFSRKGKK